MLVLSACAGRSPLAVDAVLPHKDAGEPDSGGNASADSGLDAGLDAGLDDGLDGGRPRDAGADAADGIDVDAGVLDAGAAVDALVERLRACSAAADRLDVVVVISIDGLRIAALQLLGDAQVPALRALLRAGAGTLDARTDPDWSITLPNHIGMLTGRTVNGDDGHHFTQNSDTAMTVHEARGAYTSSIFDVAHAAGVRTGLFAAKAKFQVLSRSWDAAHSADGEPLIDDLSIADQPDDVVIDEAQTVLASDSERALLFLHLRRPDQVGHSESFDVAPGSSYLDAVEETDARVGFILDSVVADARRCGRTGIILTTDHGGIAFSHSDATAPQNHTIPFVAWGPRAAACDLQALNGGRIIRNGDAGNLALHWLGLSSIPGSTLNASFDLATR